jgi:hypothetical protein
MSLRTLSKKLRHAADVLDELLEMEGTKEVAKKIKRNIVKKKLHWTQRPENKAKLRKQLRKANRVKNGEDS